MGEIDQEAAAEILCYFGHHRCGTQWAKRIVQDVASTVGLSCVIYNSARQFHGDLAKAVRESGARFLLYVNAEQRHVASLTRYRGFHIVRDPRDIAVSAYYSHLYSHPTDGWPELAAYRKQLRGLDHDAGLMRELEELAGQFRIMLDWDYANPSVLELHMEDAIRDPHGSFQKIFEFLGVLNGEGRVPQLAVTLDQKALSEIVEKNNFSALAGGRMRGEENVQSHFRKGVSGDWRNHFTAAHVDYFKSHYNELLLALGYEARADW